MSLTKSDLERISKLSQLEICSEVQSQQSLDQLNGIFNFVQKLGEVNTEGIEPLAHPLAVIVPNLALRVREDLVTEFDQRNENQSCAPAVQDGLFLVPKVLE